MTTPATEKAGAYAYGVMATSMRATGRMEDNTEKGE